MELTSDSNRVLLLHESRAVLVDLESALPDLGDGVGGHLDETSEQLPPKVLVVESSLSESGDAIGETSSDSVVWLSVERSEELSSDVVERFVGEGVDEGGRLDREVLSFGDGRRFQRESSKKEERESSELIEGRVMRISASSARDM